MGKLIFYLLIGILVYWITKSRKAKQQKEKGSLSEVIEDMVNCSQCGVYLPKSDAVHYQHKFFCCREHYLLYIKSSS